MKNKKEHIYILRKDCCIKTKITFCTVSNDNISKRIKIKLLSIVILQLKQKPKQEKTISCLKCKKIS